MHFEILCNKMVFSQKNIPRKKKKKKTGERLLGVLVENQGYDTKLYNVHSPVNILSKKKDNNK